MLVPRQRESMQVMLHWRLGPAVQSQLRTQNHDFSYSGAARQHLRPMYVANELRNFNIMMLCLYYHCWQCLVNSTSTWCIVFEGSLLGCLAWSGHMSVVLVTQQCSPLGIHCQAWDVQRERLQNGCHW